MFKDTTLVLIVAIFDFLGQMRAAFADQLYVRLRGCQSRAVFAYDERLRLFPSYLQQLEMESNGKSVKLDGSPVDGPTAPVTWGGVGTDAQHAVFQLLHQGTGAVPVDFIAAIAPGMTFRRIITATSSPTASRKARR